MKFQAHITDDWQRDSLVIQVRQMNDADVTTGIAEAVEDVDGVPVLRVRPLTMEGHGGEAIPGLRVRWDMAVAIAQALIAHTNAPADPTKVAALQQENDALAADLREREAELALARADQDRLRGVEDMLERLVEAKDSHLEREAGTVDAERFRQIRGHKDAAAALLEREVHPEKNAEPMARLAADLSTSMGTPFSEALSALGEAFRNPPRG